MQMNRTQIELVAKYFSDLSKILVASTVVAYFVPGSGEVVTLQIFVAGAIIAAMMLWVSIGLLK